MLLDPYRIAHQHGCKGGRVWAGRDGRDEGGGAGWAQRRRLSSRRPGCEMRRAAARGGIRAGTWAPGAAAVRRAPFVELRGSCLRLYTGNPILPRGPVMILTTTTTTMRIMIIQRGSSIRCNDNDNEN